MQLLDLLRKWRNWAIGLIPTGIASILFRTTVWSIYPQWITDHYIYRWLALIPAVLALLLIFVLIYYFLVYWRRSANLKSTDFVEALEHNPNDAQNIYSPIAILSRPRVTSLDVFCNGSSKWTYQQSLAAVESQIGRHTLIGCKIRFLVCCPKYLEQVGTEEAKKKAKKNANNIKNLKQLLDKFKAHCELKVYRHNPSLRLIIVSGSEIILGHYTQSGIADSKDSPLMIFNCSNNWGFGGAFISCFESEWVRAFAISDADWEVYTKIAT
jgi:hypothetical protein